MNTTIPPVPAAPVQKTDNKFVAAVKKAAHAVDVYTSPRDATAGNFEAPSPVMAVLSGSSDGLLIFGPAGIIPGVGAALAAVVTGKKFDNRIATAAAATLTGGALVAGGLALTGAAITLPAVLVPGLVFGLFEACRTDKSAERRDASNCIMMLPAVLPGTTRFTVAIGSAVGQAVKNPVAKVLLGAGTAAALTAGIAALSAGGAVALPLVLTAAIAGGAGPILGHRIWQGARNLFADMGTGVSKLAEKTHIINKPIPERIRNIMGAIPLVILKNFGKSSGNMMYTAIGSVLSAANIGWVMWKGQMDPSQKNKPVEEAAATHASEQPALAAEATAAKTE